jgi:hypothetical protein
MDAPTSTPFIHDYKDPFMIIPTLLPEASTPAGEAAARAMVNAFIVNGKCGSAALLVKPDFRLKYEDYIRKRFKKAKLKTHSDKHPGNEANANLWFAIVESIEEEFWQMVKDVNSKKKLCYCTKHFNQQTEKYRRQRNLQQEAERKALVTQHELLQELAEEVVAFSPFRMGNVHAPTSTPIAWGATKAYFDVVDHDQELDDEDDHGVWVSNEVCNVQPICL